MWIELNHRLKSWFVKPSSGVHLDFADGVRGVAILLVVISHGFYYNPQGPAVFVWLGKLIGSGWVGVRVFFVLSGFLISLPFFRAREENARFWNAPGYAMRRGIKIFPPFYAVIVVLALYYWLHYNDPEYFRLGFAWATGWAHWQYFPKYFNTSFWSLWVEIGFYVALPFLFYFLRGLSAMKTGWAIFWGLMAVSFVSRVVCWPEGGGLQETSFATSRFPGLLDNFAYGVLFSAIYVSSSGQGNKLRRNGGVIGMGGLFLFVLSCFFFAIDSELMALGWFSPRVDLEIRNLLPALSTFLVLFYLFNPRSAIAQALSSPFLKFLGIVSYEWFLIHQPAQMQFREWMGASSGNMVRYAITVLVPTILSLVVAIVIYHNYSLPLLRWGRRRVETSAPVSAVKA